jgi:protein phosphatase
MSASSGSPVDSGTVSPSPPSPRRVATDVAALTDRGRVRSDNEDSFVVVRLGRYMEPVTSNLPEGSMPERHDESGYVMIVADGLGGHEAGEQASRTTLLTAIQLILQSPKWAMRFEDPETRERDIRELAVRARVYLRGVEAEIRRRVSEDPRLEGMGTTLTGGYTAGAELFVLHIGDSKAYVLRDGALTKITRDHTVAQEYADLGVIAQEEVARHKLGHVLTRAVGGGSNIAQADFHHWPLRDGDRLLLCSDGLTDMVDEEMITGLLLAHPDSAGACRALVDAALAAGGKDNVTVIVSGFRVT